MPTRLHIDGGRFGLVDHFKVETGETLGQLAKRLGVTIREEQVEPAPLALSPEAAGFLRSYEYEDPGSVLAIYWRHGSLEAEEFDTVEEAEHFIEGGEEYDALAGEAIVSGDTITVLD